MTQLMLATILRTGCSCMTSSWPIAGCTDIQVPSPFQDRSVA